jgi:uncharacterized protein
MSIVSNTSPILNLAIIGHLHLVREQFTIVRIPPSVLHELRLNEELPGSQSIRQAVEQGWIIVEEIHDRKVVRVLQRELDWGESEAIALALQIDADRILLDEREARRVAKSLDLQVTGILGVLLRAQKEGQLASLEQAVTELQERAGFWIAPELRRGLLES